MRRLPSLTARYLGFSIALLTAGACDSGAPSGPTPAQVAVEFYGAAGHLLDLTATLALTTANGRGEWTGDAAASLYRRALLADMTVPANDRVQAEATVRDAAGSVVGRADLEFTTQAGYRYWVAFQLGGRNPDERGICHWRPSGKVAVASGDSLYLWGAEQPREPAPPC
jgi:hypothetical protein